MAKVLSSAARAEHDAMVAEIRKADMFSASIRYGPHNKLTRYFKADDPREAYQEALAAKAEMDSASPYGRQAVVYAINSLGSFSIDDALARDAGLI